MPTLRVGLTEEGKLRVIPKDQPAGTVALKPGPDDPVQRGPKVVVVGSAREAELRALGWVEAFPALAPPATKRPKRRRKG